MEGALKYVREENATVGEHYKKIRGVCGGGGNWIHIAPREGIVNYFNFVYLVLKLEKVYMTY